MAVGVVRRAYESSSLGLLSLATGDSGESWELTANPLWRQPSSPPASGRTRVIPRCLSSSATRALVASLGHVQYRTMSRLLGIS